MASNKRTTDPAVEPVTVADMDDFLRGDDVLEAEDGSLIESIITAARMYVEDFTRRPLITQTWTMYLDAWPRESNVEGMGWWDGVREGSIYAGEKRYIELPLEPIQSITSVSTYDGDGAATVFSSSNYFLDSGSSPSRLCLNNGVVWPTPTRNLNGIEIVYVAGYGDAATDVPAPLRQVIKQLATHWYQNREFTKTQSDMNQASSPLHVQSLLNRYKVMKL